MSELGEKVLINCGDCVTDRSLWPSYQCGACVSSHFLVDLGRLGGCALFYMFVCVFKGQTLILPGSSPKSVTPSFFYPFSI